MHFFTFIEKHTILRKSIAMILIVLMLSSCSSRVGTIQIKGSESVNEQITMTIYGKKETTVERISRLPVTLRLSYDNVPARVTFTSEFHNFSDVVVDKRYTGSHSSKFWKSGGNVLITLGVVSAAVGVLGFLDARDEKEKARGEEERQLLPGSVNRPLLYAGAGAFSLGLIFRGIGSARSNATLYEMEQKSYTTQISDNLDRFDVFAKKYVTSRLDAWRQKSEYESTDAYGRRVNASSIKLKQEALLNEAAEEFIRRNRPQDKITYSINPYDADNESFLITSNYGNLVVPVAAAFAKEFKDNFHVGVVKSPSFGVNQKDIIVTECTFRIPSGRTFNANTNSAVAYNEFLENPSQKQTKVDLDFAQVTAASNRNTIGKASYAAVANDKIDTDIPSGKSNDDIFVVIIGNENYDPDTKVKEVPFARNDANIFRKYCEKTLGVSSDHIKFFTDATRNNMNSAVSWLNNFVKAANNAGRDSKVIYYYAGHGVPDMVNNKSYLLPSDGYPDDFSSAIKLEDLYSSLASLGASECVVFLDACFSGVETTDNARAVGQHVAPQEKPVSGNLVVISAASDKQTSNAFTEKGHGIFTYYLLKKLHDGKGRDSLGDIYDYINKNVNTTSMEKWSKPQTPTVNPSSSCAAGWKDIRLVK